MRTRELATAVLLCLALATTFLGGILLGRAMVAGRPVVQQIGPETLAKLDEPSKAFVGASKAVQPAVAHLVVTRLVRARDPFEDFFSDEFARRFFRRGIQEQKSMGSGVIIDRDGITLTNAHVVQNAKEILARLPDGRAFRATPIGVNEQMDLAVIRIEGEDLPVARLGNSDELEVGQWVIAIGNPFGLEHTVTAGIVSAVRRQGVGVAEYEDFIQTDAPINPGNSGGPLVDLRGNVIGINTAIYSRSGGYQGIGFAIPINLAKELMERMK